VPTLSGVSQGLEPSVAAAPAGHRHGRSLPGWRRPSAGEHRIQMALAVLVAIGLQVVLPPGLGLQPHYVMPALEGAIFLALVAASPGRIVRPNRLIRLVTLLLVAALSVANATSLVLLLRDLLNGSHSVSQAGPLLLSGSSIWLTNVIVFGIWYWEFDRGGPASRALALHPYPDFMFPQQAQADLAPADWVPQFFDYLYTSFTNAAAFSPTDTMPLSRWAKMLFLVQSSISLVTAAVVVARVSNILR
jgi:hypothetical protein